ncbi:hypothetical protein HDU96_004771 [Phlyctochytrium bullatum]|nr:hypothetical protein HDU96_004771 [Phlyctochytrium bullatum]
MGAGDELAPQSNTIVPKDSSYMEDDSTTVEWNSGAACRYLCCYNCLIWTSTGWGLTFVPCVCCHASSLIKNQACTFDSKRIHYKWGVFQKVDKLLPYERIQSVNLSQIYLARCCGVKILEIRTAGGGGEDGEADVTLVGAKEPEKIRNMIYARRENLVYGDAAARSALQPTNLDLQPGASGTGEPVTTQPDLGPQMVVEFKAVKEGMVRIEGLLKEANDLAERNG